MDISTLVTGLHWAPLGSARYSSLFVDSMMFHVEAGSRKGQAIFQSWTRSTFVLYIYIYIYTLTFKGCPMEVP